MHKYRGPVLVGQEKEFHTRKTYSSICVASASAFRPVALMFVPRCYAKRYQDVERKLCPSGRYQPSCAEKMRGHYVAHGAEEGRVYGCSGERDSFKPTA